MFRKLDAVAVCCLLDLLIEDGPAFQQPFNSS